MVLGHRAFLFIFGHFPIGQEDTMVEEIKSF